MRAGPDRPTLRPGSRPLPWSPPDDTLAGCRCIIALLAGALLPAGLQAQAAPLDPAGIPPAIVAITGQHSLADGYTYAGDCTLVDATAAGDLCSFTWLLPNATYQVGLYLVLADGSYDQDALDSFVSAIPVRTPGPAVTQGPPLMPTPRRSRGAALRWPPLPVRYRARRCALSQPDSACRLYEYGSFENLSTAGQCSQMAHPAKAGVAKLRAYPRCPSRVRIRSPSRRKQQQLLGASLCVRPASPVPGSSPPASPSSSLFAGLAGRQRRYGSEYIRSAVRPPAGRRAPAGTGSQETEEARRTGSSLAVILVDVQAQSSQHGALPPVSEGVVALVAESLRGSLRGRDVVVQLGPARFGILLAPTTVAGTASVVQRLPRTAQRAVAACLPAGMVPELRLGEAVLSTDDADAAALIARAEAALEQPASIETLVPAAAAGLSFGGRPVAL